MPEPECSVADKRAMRRSQPYFCQAILEQEAARDDEVSPNKVPNSLSMITDAGPALWKKKGACTGADESVETDI